MQQQASPPSPSVVVAGYVRRSSEMQKDNYSIDAQKRAIKDACRLRGLPEPIFYEDDERSARASRSPSAQRLNSCLMTYKLVACTSLSSIR